MKIWIDPDKLRDLAASYEIKGSRVADKVIDQMVSDTLGFLEDNLEDELEENEYLEESDQYYEIISTLAHAFLGGMENAWPNNILSDRDDEL